jgi:hypothetical protein
MSAPLFIEMLGCGAAFYSREEGTLAAYARTASRALHNTALEQANV